MHALAAAIAAIGAPGVAANPSGAQVMQGSATLRQDGNRLTVTTSNGAVIHWDRFSIGAGDTTRFVQPDAASQVLNRVVGSSPSEILGRLESNGRVFLINPNGVAFGRGAQVDVGALVVSTLKLSNEDFAAGRMRFGGSAAENLAAGQIRNEGAIRTASGGTVYLVAPRVENSGLIHTPEGQVLLAAGHRVSIVNPRSPEVAWEIAAPESAAVNLGEIVARQIVLHGQVVRNAGTLQATTAVVGEDGRIVLRAQRKVEQTPAGRMSATGVDAQGRGRGGEIDIQAGEQVSLQGRVEVTPAAAPTAQAAVGAAASSLTAGGRGVADTVAPATAGTITAAAQADTGRPHAGAPAGSSAGQTPTRTREPPGAAVVAPLSGAESAAGPGQGEAGMVAEATMPAFVVSAPGGSSGVGSPRLPTGAGTTAGTSAPPQRPTPPDPLPHPDPRHAIAGGAAGTGGRVRVLAREIVLGEGLVLDASGPAGGGTVLIGGEQQGASAGGPNAQFVFMAPGARITADATADGTGGRVILWADDTAKVHGSISARGGALGGDGGFIETSGRRFLEVTRPADASAPRGRAGEWLLDPYDVEIVTPDQTPGGGLSSDELDPPDGKKFDPQDGGSASKISNRMVVEALEAGSNVRITTGTGGTQQGDIRVRAPIAVCAGAGWQSLAGCTSIRPTLMLQASNRGSIELHEGVSDGSSEVGLRLVLEAGGNVVTRGPGNFVSVMLGTRGEFDARAVQGAVRIEDTYTASVHAGTITFRNLSITGELAKLQLSGKTTVSGDLAMTMGTLQLKASNEGYRVEGAFMVSSAAGSSLIEAPTGGGPNGIALVTASSAQQPSVVSGTLRLGSGLRWTNDGYLRIAGSISLGGTGGFDATTVTNATTGTLELADSGGIFQYPTGSGNTIAVINKGLLRKTGGSVTESAISLGSPPPTQDSIFTNDVGGTVSVEGGTLSIGAGTKDAGRYVVESGATLRFDAGAREIGSLALKGGTVAHYGNAPVLTVNGGFEAYGNSVVRGSEGEFVTKGNTFLDGTLTFEKLSGGVAPKRWVSEGTLSATGTIDMMGSTLQIKESALRPGGNGIVGTLTVKGRLEVTGNQGTLEFDIGGPGESDRIDVIDGSVPGSGSLDVAGRIFMTRHGNYAPQFGDSIALITGPSPEKTGVGFTVTSYGTGLDSFALTYDLGDPLRLVGAGPGVNVFTNMTGANNSLQERLWSEANNWSTGQVPQAGASVLIATSVTRPVILRVTDAVIRELTLNPESHLELSRKSGSPDRPSLTVTETTTLNKGAWLTLRDNAIATFEGSVLSKGEVTDAPTRLGIEDARVVLNGAATFGSVLLIGTSPFLEGTGSLTVTRQWENTNFGRISGLSAISLRSEDDDLRVGPLDLQGPITLATGNGKDVVIDRSVKASGPNGSIVIAASGGLVFRGSDSFPEPTSVKASGAISIDAARVSIQGGSQPNMPAEINAGTRLTIATAGDLTLTGGVPSDSKAGLVAAELDLKVKGDLKMASGSFVDQSGVPSKGGVSEIRQVGGSMDSSITVDGTLELGSQTAGGGATITAEGAGNLVIRAASVTLRGSAVPSDSFGSPRDPVSITSAGGLSITTTAGDLKLLGGSSPAAVTLDAPRLSLTVAGDLILTGGAPDSGCDQFTYDCRGGPVAIQATQGSDLTIKANGAVKLQGGNSQGSSAQGGAVIRGTGGATVTVEASSVALTAGEYQDVASPGVELVSEATLSLKTTSGGLAIKGGADAFAHVGAPSLSIDASGGLMLEGGTNVQRSAFALISTNQQQSGSIDIRTGGAISVTSGSGFDSAARVGPESNPSGNLTVSLRSASGGISLGGPIRGSTVRIVAETAGNVEIKAQGSVTATGSGDSIVIAADNAFANRAGPTALKAESNARWMVFAAEPPADYHDLGNLPYDFKRYGQSYSPGYTDADSRNGLIYRAAPTVTAAVTATGPIRKTYNGNPSVEANQLSTLSASAQEGLVAGDSIEVNVVAASFPDNKGRAGPYNTLSVVVGLGPAKDSKGKDVYGYSLKSSIVEASGSPGSFGIDPKTLTVVNAVADSRPYNRTTSTTLSGGELAGVVGGDTVTFGQQVGHFADAAAGTNKPVTAAYTLTGADSSNYVLQQPAGLTADITPKALTVKDVTVTPRMYDRTTNATLSGTPALDGVEAGDEVGLDAIQLSGSFADPNVGTNKPVTLSGLALTGASKSNYTLTPEGATTKGSITAKPVNLVSNTATAVTRTYDGTYIATVDTLPALEGVIAGDAVEVNRNTVNGLFDNRNAGSGKSVSFTVTGLTGPSAGNYALSMNATNGTGTITPKALTVGGLGALDKTYDGTTFATVVGSPVLQGAVGNDDVSLNASGLSGSFFDRNVGQGKPVSIGGLALTGTDAANYTLGSAIASASIFARTLTISGVSALDKVYDGSTAATLSAGSLSGVIGGDQVALAGGAGNFVDRNVGSGKTVIASFGLDGADAGNYLLQQPGGLTASITPRPLTLGGLSAADRVYDGTAAATLAGTPVLQGVVAGDAVQLDGALLRGSFADRNVGQNKPVSFSGLALTGSAAGNYTLSVGSTGVTASITARPLTISGLSATDKVYDGTVAASVTGSAQLQGAIANDAVALDASGLNARFADRNVGVGKPVTIAGVSLTGADAGNYALTLDNAGLKASITARQIRLTGLAASDRVYDGTTVAAVAGTPRLEGALANDAIELDTSGLRASFADRNVGQNKPVSFSGLALRGADAGNYALSGAPATTASITPRPLDPTDLKVADRVYDGTTAAALSGGGLRGVVEGDAVSLDLRGAQASFVDRNAGVAKQATITGLRLAGADAGNYRLADDRISAQASIGQRPLNPRFTASDRVYDGTTAARVEVTDDRLEGDRFAIEYSAAFADRHAGTNKPVTVSTITLRGPDAANYKPPVEVRASATIAVRPAATWTASTSGDWMVAGNWDALPDRGNVAAVTIPAGVQVSYDGSSPVTLSSLTNAGSLVLRAPGLDATRLDNQGRLIIGAGAAIDLAGRAVLGTGTLANEGSLALSGASVANRLENTGTLRLSGDNTLNSVVNAGSAVQQGGITSLSGAWVQTAGSTVLAGGNAGAAPRLVAPGGVRIEGGRLAGSGNIVGDLSVIAGTLAPGASPGSLGIAGSLAMGEASVLDIDLGGTAPGTYDTVSTSGAISLAGALQVNSYGGFVPSATDTFGFLSGASVSGRFSSVSAASPALAALNLRHMQVTTAQGVVALPSATLAAEAEQVAQTQLASAALLQPMPPVAAAATSAASTSSSGPQVAAPSVPPLNPTTTSTAADSTTAPAGTTASGSTGSGTTGSGSSTASPGSAGSPAPGAASGSTSSDSSQALTPTPVRRTVLRTLDLPDSAPAESTTVAANREVTYTRSPSSTSAPAGGVRRNGC